MYLDLVLNYCSAPSFPWGGFCLALLWPFPIVQDPSHIRHKCRVCSRCHSTGMEKVLGVWEPATHPHFHSLSAKHKPCITNSRIKRSTCSSAERYLEKDREISLEHLACVSQGNQKTENLRAELLPATLHFCSSARCLCFARSRSPDTASPELQSRTQLAFPARATFGSSRLLPVLPPRWWFLEKKWPKNLEVCPQEGLTNPKLYQSTALKRREGTELKVGCRAKKLQENSKFTGKWTNNLVISRFGSGFKCRHVGKGKKHTQRDFHLLPLAHTELHPESAPPTKTEMPTSQGLCYFYTMV